MALTFGDFLSIFTTNDASGGRAIKATFDTGVDDAANYLTRSDPAGGRAIKIVNIGAPLGPQFWAEAYNAGTQATSSWTPVGAAADINAAIRPKGTGAIVAAIPDGTATGGNARGTYAVDLQLLRTAASQVAGSTGSTIGGGYRNTITGQFTTYSTISGGDNNLISAVNGNHFIGGGSGNQILNSANEGNCVVAGGLDNQLRSGFSVISGGRFNDTNNASQYYQVIAGGFQNNTSNEGGTISGGASNSITGNYGSIGGGQSNTVSVAHGFVGGGQGNTVSGGSHNVVAGGSSNTCSGGNMNNFIGGGTLNSVSGACQDSVNCGGRSNAVSGSWAFNGAGRNNQVTGEGASNLGRFNTVSGSHANVLGGQENTASAAYSAAISSFQGVANLYGQHIHASGRFTAAGDAQAHELIWRVAVTGTSSAELFLDGASVRAILPGTNSVWHGIIDAVAVCTTQGNGTTVAGEVEASTFKVTIKRIGTATSLVGTVQEIGTTNADASMSTGVFSFDNDDTNEALRVRFTPPTTAGSTTVIRVVATFRGTQIQY